MLKSLIRNIILFFDKKRLQKKHKLKLGKNVFINRKAVFEGRNYLSTNSRLISSYIGFASYLGENTIIRKAKIGRYTSIGPDVKCIFGKHPTNTFVSTHPAFFSTRKQSGFSFVQEQLFDEYEKALDSEGGYQIFIGNDVWIGANVSIMDGVEIGDGAIIASNSLIVKDIEPYSIVGGVPAKTIKHRFDSEHISFLLDFKWWEKDFDWIEKNSKLFQNIELFKENLRADTNDANDN